MANLIGTTVNGDLAVTGATSGQGAVPVGGIIPIVSALTGSHTIPGTGTVDADGWQYCDGAVIPISQTLSGTTPNLTDGRFLRGFTTSSGCGGAETFTLAEGNLAAHTHGGVTGACAATTGACSATTGTFSANHTHTFTTGAQNCQHCHCICDAGTHSHSYQGTLYNNYGSTSWTHTVNCGSAGCGTDGRHHCAEHTCCTLSSVTHLHSGTTATVSANHTHSVPSHTHAVASHTHTVASAGSGTAKSHIPVYFNVKYLMRVI